MTRLGTGEELSHIHRLGTLQMSKSHIRVAKRSHQVNIELQAVREGREGMQQLVSGTLHVKSQ